MSRIGKKPLAVPNGVTVTVDGLTVRVKGPRGELTRRIHPALQVAVDGASVSVARPSDEPLHKALHGLTRTLIANMIVGVTAGFRKQLEIVGVGYKAETRPYGLQLALGFSHAVNYRAPAGIKLTAPQPTSILVEGANKEVVGQVAAEIRGLRPPEPYKGKGIKYLDEQVRRKAGKTGAK
jgi:large subunit ribosomal protein L6